MSIQSSIPLIVTFFLITSLLYLSSFTYHVFGLDQSPTREICKAGGGPLEVICCTGSDCKKCELRHDPENLGGSIWVCEPTNEKPRTFMPKDTINPNEKKDGGVLKEPSTSKGGLPNLNKQNSIISPK